MKRKSKLTIARATAVLAVLGPTSLSDCGNTCHKAVKAKDYIFHPYQKR